MKCARKSYADKIVTGLYFLIISMGFHLSLLSVLGIKIQNWQVYAVSLGIGIWFVIIFWNPKYRIYFILLTVAISGVIAFKNREILENGLQQIINMIREHVENYYNVSYVPFPAGKKIENFYFAFFVICLPWLGVLGYKVVGRKKFRLFYLTYIFILCGGLLINKIPGPVPVLLMTSALLGLAAMAKIRTREENAVIYAKTGLTMLLFSAGLLLISYFILQPQSEETMLQYYPKAMEMQKKIEMTVSDRFQQMMDKGFSLLKNSDQENVIEEGRLSNQSGKQKGTNTIKLIMNKDPGESIYLKGFVGDTYLGDSWSMISDKELLNANRNFGFSGFEREELQNLPYEYQKEYRRTENNIQEDEIQYRIEIQNVAGKYAYIPYFSKPQQDLIYDADGLVLRKDQEQEVLKYTGYTDVQYIQKYNMFPEEKKRNLEEKYREYVYEHYTKLPEELKRLRSYCRELEEQYKQSGDWNALEAAEVVRTQLRENCSYELKLNDLPEGKDFVEYFFFEQKKGFCVHFATTGTLMLRMMGFPARYVTGYLAKQQEFQSADDHTTVQITDREAHAWVEVYLDSMGWVPVEMTPGYSGQRVNENHTETEYIPEEPTPTPAEQPTDTPQPTPTENPEQQSNIGGTDEPESVEIQKQIPAVYLFLFSGIGFLLFLSIVAIVRRYLLELIRSKKYSGKDSNRAVWMIVRDTCKMLKRAGYGVENFHTEEEYVWNIQNGLTGLKENEFIEFYQKGQRAVFGGDLLTKKERQECIRERKRINRLITRNWGTLKKFWWYFIQGY